MSNAGFNLLKISIFSILILTAGQTFASTPNNSAPTLNTLGHFSILANLTLVFPIAPSATDIDGDSIIFSATNLPPGATLNSETGEFSWTPGSDVIGSTFEITFTATEDTEEALFDTETMFLFIVSDYNAPVIDPIGNQIVNEGDTLEFTVLASDVDGNAVFLTASNLPAGAIFNPDTGLFSWDTDYDDAGNYSDIEFTATDDGIPMQLDVELITITVGDVNRTPVITNLEPQEVQANAFLSFNISATDPDGDVVTYSASDLPEGSSFNQSNGNFEWIPSVSDIGVYTISFIATDDGTPEESAIVDVVITVGDNPTPTEQAQDLIENVINIDIPQNIESSYLANLRKVEQFIFEGKITPALNQLNAFKNKVQQDYQQGRLTQAQYQQLTAAANALIADLNN